MKMPNSSNMKDCVRGIKNLKLGSPQAQAQRLKPPEKSRAAEAIKAAFPGHANISEMSLPGLELSAPVETAVTPTVHELKEQTEWRFEVAFGTRVEVRVRCPNLSTLFDCLNVRRITQCAAPLRHR